MAENNTVSYLEIRFDEYSHLSERNFIRDMEGYLEMPLGSTLYTYDKIKGDMDEDIRNIGIYRSLGMTGR